MEQEFIGRDRPATFVADLRALALAWTPGGQRPPPPRAASICPALAIRHRPASRRTRPICSEDPVRPANPLSGALNPVTYALIAVSGLGGTRCHLPYSRSHIPSSR